MAKRTKRFTRKKWQPRPSDAINLATIRWFALMIEGKAIEIYGTNSKVYPDILTVLGNCLSAVEAIKVEKPMAEEGDCPPGWVQCGDECAPRCMGDAD